MKRYISIVMGCILLVGLLAFSGCATAEAPSPKDDIVGTWGGRSDDTEAVFEEDGTCIIGGITGTYEVDEEDNSLVVTPNGGRSTTFTWSTGTTVNEIGNTEWTIVEDQIFVNGFSYTKQETKASSLVADASSQTSSVSSGGSVTSGTNDNDTSSGSSTSSSVSSDSSSASSTSSSSSQSSSSPASDDSSSDSPNVSEGVPDVIEYLD